MNLDLKKGKLKYFLNNQDLGELYPKQIVIDTTKQYRMAVLLYGNCAIELLDYVHFR